MLLSRCKLLQTNRSCKPIKLHGVKSVRISSYSGPHFPAFGLTVSLCIQFKCAEMRARITPNSHTFYAVLLNLKIIDLKLIEPKFFGKLELN